jgi:hypothetical protein
MAQQTETIHWRSDVDAALDEARIQQKNALVDFSAAPM